MTSPPGQEPKGFPPFAVTVDVVLLTVRDGQLEVALVERRTKPFQGMWALPGGFVEVDEDLSDAAARELLEETGLDVPAALLTQLGAYGAPGRDPRMRVVTVVFWALLPGVNDPVGGSDAASCRLFPVYDALAEGFELAFDHRAILTHALERAQAERGS